MLRLFVRALSTTLLLTLLAGGIYTPVAMAQGSKAKEQRVQLTARQAAAQARAQYGGKVLKVRRQGNGYTVRLLQDSGRVITVTIRG